MILILSQEIDIHARLVRRRLLEKGADVVIFDLAEVPSHARMSARISPAAGPRLQIRREREPTLLDLGKVEAVWYRRWFELGVAKNMSTADQEFSKNESICMLLSLAAALEDRFWVNPIAFAEVSEGGNGKIGHLELARTLGLAVPETLATNDPDEARAFIAQCSSGAIYKPFRTAIRTSLDDEGQEQPTMLFTTKLDPGALARLDGVAHAPCIFQELVPKKFELRVIVMGKRVFACELHSQVRDEFAVDFRHDPDMTHMPHVPHDLPHGIADKLIALNEKLGLVYGAFDLIVTPEGSYVFLEVNQQGQFLWLEEQAGIPLLENFTEMLLQRRADFDCNAPLHSPGPWPPFPDA